MKRAYLVAGLAFGDEGKGSIVDYLCRVTDAKLIVRYNGGPQCAHNVVTPEGLHHTFAQFGSGTLIPDVKTYLSRYMLVNPFALVLEALCLQNKGIVDALDRLYISKDAVIVTPYHKFLNRLKESSVTKNGSCGMGVGEARADELNGITLRMRDITNSPYLLNLVLDVIKSETIIKAKQLKLGNPSNYWWNQILDLDPVVLAKNYSELPKFQMVEEDWLEDYKGDMVFEGAQGMLLDETHGFAPHNTWTDITFNNAFNLLEFKSEWKPIKIGVIRTYFTRHGNGPFPTEIDYYISDGHNPENEWQGKFRCGHFDAVLGRYALKHIGGVDCLALTHTDLFPPMAQFSYVNSYHVEINNLDISTAIISQVKPNVEHVNDCKVISELLNTPIGIVSNGPTWKDKVADVPFEKKRGMK